MSDRSIDAGEEVVIGEYWESKAKKRFVIRYDSAALQALMQDATNGARVYELMSIRRPADVLHYIYVDISSLDTELIKHVQANIKHHDYGSKRSEAFSVCFTEFSKTFFYQFDDTCDSDRVWLNYLDSDEYQELVSDCFARVLMYQSQLSTLHNDYLLQKELQLIKENKHPLDFAVELERHDNSKSLFNKDSDEQADAFFEFLAELIKKTDIKSVSCPYGGFRLWRILVNEQMLRADKQGNPPQEALALYGSDEGIGDFVEPSHWGGYVHLPYEGMCEADLVFLPSWRVFRQEHAGEDGSLAKATMLGCKYLLSFKYRDLGDLACAQKQEVGEWILYTNRV